MEPNKKHSFMCFLIGFISGAWGFRWVCVIIAFIVGFFIGNAFDITKAIFNKL